MTDDDKPFSPSAQQVRYLAAWLDPNSPDTIKGLAAQVHITRRNVYRWIDDPRFCRWFADSVERFFGHDRLAMWKKCLQLAKAGSPEHIKLVAQRSGELRPEFPGNSENRPGALQIFLNVPRPALNPAPPEPDTIDLTPLVLPAQTSIEEH